MLPIDAACPQLVPTDILVMAFMLGICFAPAAESVIETWRERK